MHRGDTTVNDALLNSKRSPRLDTHDPPLSNTTAYRSAKFLACSLHARLRLSLTRPERPVTDWNVASCVIGFTQSGHEHVNPDCDHLVISSAVNGRNFCPHELTTNTLGVEAQHGDTSGHLRST